MNSEVPIEKKIASLKIFISPDKIYEEYIRIADEYIEFRKIIENSLLFIRNNTTDNFVKNKIASILIREGFDEKLMEVTDENIDCTRTIR